MKKQHIHICDSGLMIDYLITNKMITRNKNGEIIINRKDISKVAYACPDHVGKYKCNKEGLKIYEMLTHDDLNSQIRAIIENSTIIDKQNLIKAMEIIGLPTKKLQNDAEAILNKYVKDMIRAILVSPLCYRKFKEAKKMSDVDEEKLHALIRHDLIEEVIEEQKVLNYRYRADIGQLMKLKEHANANTIRDDELRNSTNNNKQTE
jgi:hypothetical protein